jgi:L-lactate dehydrogenase complex protein LldG
MTAREEVLARVRRAMPTERPVVPRDYQRVDDRLADLELFVDRLLDYRAVVHRCTAAELPAVLGALMAGRVVVPSGLPGEWIACATGEVVRDTDLTAAALDELDAVVTTCAVAIAETGTVVLDAGPGQGRRALSLVPDRHLLIVRADQVVATVPQSLTRLDPTRPQTWISGPSATSDIELQRVEGVHGPRRLEVLLVT